MSRRDGSRRDYDLSIKCEQVTGTYSAGVGDPRALACRRILIYSYLHIISLILNHTFSMGGEDCECVLTH